MTLKLHPTKKFKEMLIWFQHNIFWKKKFIVNYLFCFMFLEKNLEV